VNAISETGTAGFLARYGAAKGRLPGDSTLRAAAADAFRTLGLPGTMRGRRSEAWKYTTLQPLGGMSFRAEEPDFKASPRHGADQWLNFRAGRFVPGSSSSVPGFTRFSDTPDFGELSWPDRDPMVALNTMLAEDGAVLTVPPNRDVGLVYLSQFGIDGTSAHPRHMIRLDRHVAWRGLLPAKSGHRNPRRGWRRVDACTSAERQR